MNLIGTTLGNYEIQSEIGHGGSSIVYRATDLRDQKDIALKVMLPELIDNEMALRRFLREGNAASRLRHANIVQIYEASQAEGHHYIAMEFINGGTLSDHIKQRGTLLETEEIIAILSQIGAALDHAHSQGIVHRDLKPSNILLTGDNRATLSDFGIAKHLFSEQTMVTAVGRAVGTPSFMSPEQITGESEIDYRSDIFSLGVIAYVLFTGRTPFAAETTPQLMYRIAYENPISPEIINPGVSQDIAFVLLKALSKEPHERYNSAHKFTTSLAACQGYDCEVISRQKPAKYKKFLERSRPKFSFHKKIPVEALMGALISSLVLLIILSPTLSVTPKFILTKLGEIDMFESVQLAIAANRQQLPNAASSTGMQASSFGAAIKEVSLAQMAQSLPAPIDRIGIWGTFDQWMQNGYSKLVILLDLEGGTPASIDEGTTESAYDFMVGPKPALPTISPKLQPHSLNRPHWQ